MRPLYHDTQKREILTRILFALVNIHIGVHNKDKKDTVFAFLVNEIFGETWQTKMS